MDDTQQFENIKNLKYKIDNIIIDIKNISVKLIKYYHDLIKENNTNLFIFGIDSLYFQNKLIEIELKNSLNLFDLILNRIYCEYYKLYKMMYSFSITHFKNNEKIINYKPKNEFPKYDDLDIYKKYDFVLIINIQDEIDNMFSILNNILNDKMNSLSTHRKKNNIGLNIDNFVNTYDFEVNHLQNQIKLFNNYLNFFYNNHFKNLNIFCNKIHLFYKQINNDLNFNINEINNYNDTIKNNIDINNFNNNDSLNINEILEINEMFTNDIKIE